VLISASKISGGLWDSISFFSDPFAVGHVERIREHFGFHAGLESAPLAFWVGYEDPRAHADLYSSVVDDLAVAVAAKLDADRAANAAGVVINSCGWVDGDGFAALLKAASAFSVDTVLVLAHDRLYADLKAALPPAVAVAKLPRSGGVVQRDSAHRRRDRHRRHHEYFYGPHSHVRSLLVKKDGGADAAPAALLPPLAPATHELPFSKVRVFKVLMSSAHDDSMLPVGQASLLDPLQVVAVTVTPTLVHSVLAVLHADDDADDAAHAPANAASPHQHLLHRAAAGFVVVTNVNPDAQTISLLASCSGDLPSRNLVLGKVEWMEASLA
jgi:polyribonucleotide 5'-hydroxyl-kinase